MADLFKREGGDYKAPITADRCTISWDGGPVTAALQVSINYAQQVQRRRTIGNKEAAIWATFPQGQITIQRMLTDSAAEIFGKPGWDACKPASTVTFTMAGCNGGGPTLTASDCIVTQYSVSAESEGLTVVDNIVIEFLKLSQ